ncbi:MAG: L-glyceraldehyde 3-phosphate reductase [Myxococcota bacterium]|nr:L-glyceraldehyde 3-phosphate reductase [Myxococcota bacterium]
MQYRQAGNSGLWVSTISIGGWLTYGGSVEDRTTMDIFRKSVDAGVNFIDLADIYARGEAETVIGKGLRDLRRQDLVISSKVYWPMTDNVNDKGLSRKHIMESVHGSLKRLNTDYLDLYFCHRWDEHTPLEETVRAMDDLIHQGKVLYWGTSMWTSQQLESAYGVANLRNLYPPTVEQPRYNLLDRSIESSIMPTAMQLGMGLVVWSPLAQGVLTGKYNSGKPKGSRGAETKWLDRDLSEDNLARVRQLTAMAGDMGCTTGQLALAWLLTRPEISSVITGATSVKQLQENIAASELKIDESTAAAIDALFR